MSKNRIKNRVEKLMNRKARRAQKSARARQGKKRSSADYSNLEPRQLLAPVAGGDFYEALNNTRLEVTPSPNQNNVSVKVAGSVFDNDSGFQSIIFGGGTTELGGNATFFTDGGFRYDPPSVEYPAGTEDTFSYTIEDSAGERATGTVTVTIGSSDWVWYVDPAAAAGGDGSSDTPYQSLNDIPNNPGIRSGDHVLVQGDSSFSGIPNLTNVHIGGSGADFVVDGKTILVDQGIDPVITETSGSGVSIGDDVKLAGLTLNSNVSEGLEDATQTYIHTTTSTNISGHETILDHPLLNGNRNAIVQVTQNFGAYNDNTFGIYFAGSQWRVFNQNFEAIPEGTEFNIHISAFGDANAFYHSAGEGNTSGHVTYIDHPALNGNPNAHIQVTQMWNAARVGDSTGVYNANEIGVYYEGPQWLIYNQNIEAMPEGADFSILIADAGATSFEHEASVGTNINSHITTIDHPALNGNPNADIQVTNVWGGEFNDNAYGVWYNNNSENWTIFNQDTSVDMVGGAKFNILVGEGISDQPADISMLDATFGGDVNLPNRKLTIDGVSEFNGNVVVEGIKGSDTGFGLAGSPVGMTFNGFLSVTPETDQWAIDLSGGAADSISILGGLDVYPKDFTAGPINGIRAWAGDTVNIYDSFGTGVEADIDVDDNFGFGGKAIDFQNATIQTTFRSINAGLGTGPAINITDVDGNFYVFGNEDFSQSGDGSGGTIWNRSGTAVYADNLNGELILQNMDIVENSGHAVFVNDADLLGVYNSYIDNNGGVSRWNNSVRANNVGSVNVNGSVITNTDGYVDLNVLNDRSQGYSVSVTNSVFGGSDDTTGHSVSITGFGNSSTDTIVTGNTFFDNNDNHLFVRTNSTAYMYADVGNNTLDSFDGNGLFFRQVGSSVMDFNAYDNNITGNFDMSSKFGVYIEGQSTASGGGAQYGYVTNNTISQSRGLLYNLRGFDNNSAYGYLEVGDNDFDNFAAYSAIGAIVDKGVGNQLDVNIYNNVLSQPVAPNAVGVRVVGGLFGSSTPNQFGSVNAEIENNTTTAGWNAGYYFVERNQNDFNLTTDASSSKVGSTFNNTDGGVLDDNGNLLAGDGLMSRVLGQIDIIAELF